MNFFKIYRETYESGTYFAIIDGNDVSYLSKEIDPEYFYILKFRINNKVNPNIQKILAMSSKFILWVDPKNLNWDSQHKRITVDGHYYFKVCENYRGSDEDYYDLTNEFDNITVPDYMVDED